MLKVILKAVNKRYLLDHIDWEFITQHLNQPLTISSISFDEETGEPDVIAVSMCNVYNDIVPLFIKGNEVKYEFVGALLQHN